MVSIIIYTRPEVLEHKKGNIKNEDYSPIHEYCWKFDSRPMPKRLNEDDKIYFATKGFIRGYFEILEIDWCDIVFDARTWTDIEPIPTKSFQGFKYVDKVPELN